MSEICFVLMYDHNPVGVFIISTLKQIKPLALWSRQIKGYNLLFIGSISSSAAYVFKYRSCVYYWLIATC